MKRAVRLLIPLLALLGFPPVGAGPALAQGVPTEALIVTGAGAGGGPHVKVFDQNGAEQTSFFAYSPTFTGGVHVASGDIDGDDTDEIITGAGSGGGPHLRVFNLDGTPFDPDGPGPATEISTFAYSVGFTGGVFVGAADLDGDSADEIITGAGPGGGPHVRVWDFDPGTGTLTELVGFFAYGPGFPGGVRVAGGDVVDAGPFEEIVTGPGPGGGPHLKLFGLDGASAVERLSVFAFEPDFTGGLFVGTGDLETPAPDDDLDEIVTGAGEGGLPLFRLWRGDGSPTGPPALAYSERFRGGVRVDAFDGRGILTGAGPGGGPHVRAFVPGAEASFFPYSSGFTGGVFVAWAERLDIP